MDARVKPAHDGFVRSTKPTSQRFQNLHQLGMHVFIAADHAAGLERVVVARDAAEDAAGLANDDLPCSQVPRLQVAFPIAVEAAGGDESHVERGRAEPAQARYSRLNFAQLGARQFEVAASDMRQAARDHAFAKVAPAGDPQPLIVEEGALATLGDIEVVIGRIVDQAGDHGALALQADRNREVRDAVQEVRGAVERIDDPGVALVVAYAGPAFLADEAITRPRPGEVGVQHLLGAPVGHGDEIGGPFQRYLKVLDLAEVALETAAGAARGFDHDVD